MRFLIDECLTPALVAVANEEGFEAYHVVYRGWAGLDDRVLFTKAASENFSFVTDNRRDFLKLAKEVDLHPGLIIILPDARLERQIELFRLTLACAATLPSMINTVVEIRDHGLPQVYELPPL